MCFLPVTPIRAASGKTSAKAGAPNRGTDQKAHESVASLRQVAPPIASAHFPAKWAPVRRSGYAPTNESLVAQPELVDLAVQGGAGNVEVLRGLGDVAARARERT